MEREDLIELLAAIQSGDAIAWGTSGSISMHALPEHWQEAMLADCGDMNAALALHGALLPGWRWYVGQFSDGEYDADSWSDGCRPAKSYGPTPARALLIATLRGVIAKAEQVAA